MIHTSLLSHECILASLWIPACHCDPTEPEQAGAAVQSGQFEYCWVYKTEEVDTLLSPTPRLLRDELWSLPHMHACRTIAPGTGVSLWLSGRPCPTRSVSFCLVPVTHNLPFPSPPAVETSGVQRCCLSCHGRHVTAGICCTLQVSYKREGDDFQLRFSHKFESSEEVFFAFAIPYSYRDTQVGRGAHGSCMLLDVDLLHFMA